MEISGLNWAEHGHWGLVRGAKMHVKHLQCWSWGCFQKQEATLRVLGKQQHWEQPSINDGCGFLCKNPPVTLLGVSG